MKRGKKRGIGGTFSLSFLDAISCGFGAIVILLVLTKIGEPGALEAAREDLDARIAALRLELESVRGETDTVRRELARKERQLSEEEDRIAQLRAELSRIQGEFAATAETAEVQEILEGRLMAAQQTLTDEMKRLLAEKREQRPDDPTIGGIPVDSEFIIFVIDT